MTRTICPGFAIASLLFVAPSAFAQNFDEIKIESIPMASNVYMLTGSGGNLGLSVGDDGAFLIDDQFAPLTEKITAEVRKHTDKPIRFVVNSHWHGDHTGGNENLGKAGAIIVAHENVRKRLSTEQFMKAFNRTVPPSPEAALPVVTFQDSITFHWNGDEIQVIHVEPAHTDGDSVLYFKKANVLHTGDTYFNGMYPFIDAGSGGSIDGMIRAADRTLKFGDDQTKIIPGHGPPSNKAGLREFQAMLKTARDRIQKLVNEGKTRDEIIAAKPTKDLDEKWGKGFMQPDRWVGIVYDGMTHLSKKPETRSPSPLSE